MVPCIQVNKLLIDIWQLLFEIPLISLLIKINQALKHKCMLLTQSITTGPGQTLLKCLFSSTVASSRNEFGFVSNLGDTHLANDVLSLKEIHFS